MDTDRARRAFRQATSPRGSRACRRARWESPRASRTAPGAPCRSCVPSQDLAGDDELLDLRGALVDPEARSEEHTSELQSRSDIVCRLLLEKKRDAMITQIYEGSCEIQKLERHSP